MIAAPAPVARGAAGARDAPADTMGQLLVHAMAGIGGITAAPARNRLTVVSDRVATMGQVVAGDNDDDGSDGFSDSGRASESSAESLAAAELSRRKPKPKPEAAGASDKINVDITLCLV